MSSEPTGLPPPQDRRRRVERQVAQVGRRRGRRSARRHVRSARAPTARLPPSSIFTATPRPEDEDRRALQRLGSGLGHDVAGRPHQRRCRTRLRPPTRYGSASIASITRSAAGASVAQTFGRASAARTAWPSRAAACRAPGTPHPSTPIARSLDAGRAPHRRRHAALQRVAGPQVRRRIPAGPHAREQHPRVLAGAVVQQRCACAARPPSPRRRAASRAGFRSASASSPARSSTARTVRHVDRLAVVRRDITATSRSGSASTIAVSETAACSGFMQERA